MLRTMLLILNIIGVGGACKRQELQPQPLKPTRLYLHVLFQQTQQPVDSAHIILSGTKGSISSGREFKTFFDGYTDKQGRLQTSMLIPREYFAVLVCSKLIKIGNRYKAYQISSLQPYSDELKHEQENKIVAQLDTLR